MADKVTEICHKMSMIVDYRKRSGIGTVMLSQQKRGHKAISVSALDGGLYQKVHLVAPIKC